MEEFMNISEEHQQDIAEYGRTIICIIDEQNSEVNRWSYSIGNSISENPTPELLCFFPHRHTVSWVLNQLSDSLRLEEIKPLSPGEVVEVRGVLGDLKEFPLLLKYLTPDEQRYCWDNFTYRLSPDVPVMQVEIPDTAGYYSHEPGSPSQHVEGHTPDRLAITTKPDRCITNLWGAPKNPVNVNALRDNLRYLVDILADSEDTHTEATLDFLFYLAQQEFNFDANGYGEASDADEEQAHHSCTIGYVQALLNYRDSLEWINEESSPFSPYGEDSDLQRYWYNIKPTAKDLQGELADEFNGPHHQINYECPDAFCADLNWQTIRWAIKFTYDNSLDAGKTMEHRIFWKTTRMEDLTAEEIQQHKEFLDKDIAAAKAAKKQNRFTISWLKNKIKSLFSK